MTLGQEQRGESGRKRKRSEELGQNDNTETYGYASASSQSQKRSARTHQRSTPSENALENAARVDLPEAAEDPDYEPIHRWIEAGSWSGGNLGQDSNMAKSQSSTPSLSEHESDMTEDSQRERKHPLVKSQRYETILESAGIFMGKLGIPTTNECKSLCETMLESSQPTPQDTIFRDDRFKMACENIRIKNEARIIQDIGRLIVPSPETLTLFGATHLKHLTETVKDDWYKSIPLVKGPRPQPGFAVGFTESALTSEQLRKLQPSIGKWQTRSRLVATDDMLLPFLTAEVVCCDEALRVAERQNAHSAAVAANAVVELYRLVSRQDELHQRILTFSVSHDNRAVSIYGHYALIDGKSTSFNSYLVDGFDLISKDGRDKWTAYKFVRNVYDKFYPIHLERICSAVDQLPDPEDFDVDPFSPRSHHSFEQNDSQLTTSNSQQTGSQLQSPQTPEPVFKKAKGKGKK